MQESGTENSLSSVARVTVRAVEKLQKRVLSEAVRALEQGLPAREGFLWDTDIRNFGVRVKPSGTATFILRLRIGHERRQESIGIFGSPWTVEMAREKATLLQAGAINGVDPKQVRQDAAKEPTVEKLARRFMEEVVETKRKPATAREYGRQFEKIILPALGKRLVKDITFEEMNRLHHDLRATPIQANRVRATLSKMFNLAEEWGIRLRHSNPCTYVEKFPEQPRKRFLSEAEFKRLGKALSQVEDEGSEGPYVVAAVRLLIFTGARLTEILTLRWDQVDKERRFLRLPDHKTSSSTGEKIIHLNEAALDVLDSLPVTLGNPHVIPGRRQQAHLVNLEDSWQRIRAKAKIQDVHLHDLRHSFGSVLVSSGVSLHMIGALLGQTQAATTQRYAHLAPSPLKDANEAAGAKIREAMSG